MTSSVAAAGVRHPSPSRRSWLSRFEAMTTVHVTIAVAALFVALTFFIYWPLWPGDPHRIVGCACADPALQSWFLGWTPWAILHGHNPFFTTAMDYPRGVNLAANTLMPLLGVLFYPVTALLGATTTFSLLMWLAYPLSGLSAFHVVRSWSSSNVAGLLAGVLYGFSPYIVHQGYGHLNLTFVPLPPLIFYAVYKILVVHDGRARRRGAALGALVVAQYFISTEVLLTTALIVTLAGAAWVLFNLSRLRGAGLRYVADALGTALVVTVVALAYPVWFGLFGPNGIHVPYQGGVDNPYRADLLAPLFPTSLQYFATGSLRAIGNRLTNGQLAENGSYLGVPLVVTFLGLWLYNWRDRAIRVAGLIAVACWVVSLGPWLVVDARATTIPLPFDLLARLPGVGDALPVRLSLYVMFFVAVTVAMAAARHIDGLVHADAMGRPRHRALVGLVVAGLVVSIVAIAPVLPTTTQSTDGVTPSFFTTSEADAIPNAAVVLTYPYAYALYNQQPLLWQVDTDFRWRMLGAYASIPRSTPGGVVVSVFPWPQVPTTIARSLEYWESSGSRNRPSGPVPRVTRRLVTQARVYLHRNHVDAVVVDLATVDADPALRLFRAALGPPTIEGGVAAWTGLTSRGL